MISIDDFNAHIANGGTLDDLVEKLALPAKPTKISLVEIPANKTIRKSVEGPQQWPNIPYQNGGYTQYQILGYSQSNAIPTQWYSQTADLNTIFQ